MPIYAYKCTSCGFAQDEMLKGSDASLTVCPSCGEAQYAKQVTAPGFALRGTGWYATDFKGGTSKKADAQPDVKPEVKPDATSVSSTVASPVSS